TDPRAHRGASSQLVAAIHEKERRRVVAVIGIARTHDAEIVYRARDFRENLADLDAAPAIFAEAERRSHEIAGGAVGFDFRPRHRLAIAAGQLWLGIEGIDM